MMTIAILLVLLINLVFTAILIAGLYYLSIQKLEKKLESELRVVANRPQLPGAFPPVRRPEGILPDMDDIPEEAFYGEDEEEDFRTRPEDVEDALAERTFNSYNAPRTNPLQQLRALNPDDAA
jgi:hypothetical protein